MITCSFSTQAMVKWKRLSRHKDGLFRVLQTSSKNNEVSFHKLCYYLGILVEEDK